MSRNGRGEWRSKHVVIDVVCQTKELIDIAARLSSIIAAIDWLTLVGIRITNIDTLSIHQSRHAKFIFTKSIPKLGIPLADEVWIQVALWGASVSVSVNPLVLAAPDIEVILPWNIGDSCSVVAGWGTWLSEAEVLRVSVLFQNPVLPGISLTLWEETDDNSGDEEECFHWVKDIFMPVWL